MVLTNKRFDYSFFILVTTLFLISGCQGKYDRLEEKEAEYSQEVSEVRSLESESLSEASNTLEEMKKKGEKIKSSAESLLEESERSEEEKRAEEILNGVESSLEKVEEIEREVHKRRISGIYEDQLGSRLLLRSDGVCRFEDDDPEDECRWSVQGQSGYGELNVEIKMYGGPANVHIGDLQAVADLNQGKLDLGRAVYRKIN